MNPLKQDQREKLNKTGNGDLARKVDEIVKHLNNGSKETPETYFEEVVKKRITDMLFECYPEDMENFDSMTDSQAYRLLKEFWKMLGN